MRKSDKVIYILNNIYDKIFDTKDNFISKIVIQKFQNFIIKIESRINESRIRFNCWKYAELASLRLV